MNINVQPLVESNNAFALDLYTKLCANDDNFCFSPFSILTALAMTFAGARDATERQMKEVMNTTLTQAEFHQGFGQLLKQITAVGQGENIELLLANSIYPYNKYSLLESFVTCLKQNYKAIVTPLDYSDSETARKFINQWVGGKTKSHISELIPAGVLDQLTRLVLVNAIYFKGFWEKQFDRQLTTERPFRVLDDYAVVPMMCQNAEFGYGEDELVQILELPYQDNHLSLLVILPKEELSNFEGSLTYRDISKWTSGLSYETVNVSLPSFKIRSNFNLNDTLARLGMSDAFGERADFSGVDGTKELYIKSTLHQADIEVSEEGVTAAAATAFVADSKGGSLEHQFNANHPFMFLLRENTTGSILFIGRVVNPTV